MYNTRTRHVKYSNSERNVEAIMSEISKPQDAYGAEKIERDNLPKPQPYVPPLLKRYGSVSEITQTDVSVYPSDGQGGSFAGA